ncbi:MAG: DUF951 domain-containing protein [Clostridia bacterium]|nr:DUF951 domain-containing protein [Clostridia bacterium]
MANDFGLGDRVIMRKPHACGCSEWEIVRTGADVKIKCAGCGRLVMLDRGDFIRAAKKLIYTNEEKVRPEEAVTEER